jgi:hypothetical protein
MASLSLLLLVLKCCCFCCWALLLLLLQLAIVSPSDCAPVAAAIADGGVNAGLVCDFEDNSCRWQWTRFQRKSAADINSTIYSSSDPAMVSGPLDDADGRTNGESYHAPFIIHCNTPLFYTLSSTSRLERRRWIICYCLLLHS